ncbi:unnamed protein product [Thlaspi arvense]|uniref:Bifunctional inhibitor/plant lipid transfer protein/seed storage helical domain-containing protein n=1 Tax=Thlaspi arvense TaxID=13288 RepID=A0AAU9SJP1_THLAR|nr:unnamed protein product [Thlaspi arvense]
MKIIASLLIAVIIPLTSFPAPIIAPPAASGGGGGGGVGVGGGARFNGGFSGSGTGYRGGDNTGGAKQVDPSQYPKQRGATSYRGNENLPGKPDNGGNVGVAIVILPKRPAGGTLPPECKAEVHKCIDKYIYGGGGAPPRNGECCTKIKNSIPCVCRFITSKDPLVRKAADVILRGCHYRKPICINMAMPATCRPEVRHCVNTHLYGYGGQPKRGGACCTKFKNAKDCVVRFLTSPDPKLSEAGNALLRGCRFRRPANT